MSTNCTNPPDVSFSGFANGALGSYSYETFTNNTLTFAYPSMILPNSTSQGCPLVIYMTNGSTNSLTDFNLSCDQTTGTCALEVYS